jgi:hypothetical protein
MKIFRLILLTLCISIPVLSGCGGVTPNVNNLETTPAEINSGQSNLTHSTKENPAAQPNAPQNTGFRMVSDGPNLYYCQYDFPGLRKLNAGLSKEVIFTDEDCRYLTLAGDRLYYFVPESGFWTVKTDGSSREQLGTIDDVDGLTYTENSLFYLSKGNIFRKEIHQGSNETPASENGNDFAASEEESYIQSKPVISDYAISFVIDSGYLFYTTRIDNNLKIFRTDLNGEGVLEIADHVGSDIYPWNDRLFYLEEEATDDELKVLTRICSISRDGSDKKILFEELNAGGEFSLSNGIIYFTRYRSGGPDNFEGNFLYRMNTEGGEVTGLYDNYEVSDVLQTAGNILWFNNFSYETGATTNYLGSGLGSGTLVAMEDLHVSATRSDSLGPYVDIYGPGISHLLLIPGSSSACFKLVRTDGTIEFTKMMQPDTSETVDFPSGRYTLKIARGDAWLGDEQAFGPAGEYSTTDLFQFKPGMTYEIKSGNRGDFAHDSMEGFVE